MGHFTEGQRRGLSDTTYKMGRQKSAYFARKAEIYREIKTIYHETGSILEYRSMRIFLQRIRNSRP